MHIQQKLVKALVGRKIIACVAADVGAGKWPALQLDNGSLLLIQADAEGNGGGFMVLLDKNQNEVGAGGC